MQSQKRHQGFTLIELMVVSAILAITAAIAIPSYLGYVQETKVHAAMQNAEPLRLALEDYFLDNNTYIAGTWLPAGAQTLADPPLGWRPDGDGNQYNYTVAAGAGGIATSYSITVQTTDGEATAVCVRDQAAGTYSCTSP